MAIKFTTDDKLIVAVDDAALFDLASQRKKDKHPAPGVAFAFVQKLLALNGDNFGDGRQVECILLSRSDPHTGASRFNSLAYYGLGQMCAGANTNGRSPLPYLNSYKVDLFLTANEMDAREALAKGHGAALIYPRRGDMASRQDEEVRLGFDFDGVLGSDESEIITDTKGLAAYIEHEDQRTNVLMPAGPFMPVAQAFNRLKATGAPVRISVISARLAPHDQRVLLSTKHWGIEVDEMIRTGTDLKGPHVREHKADFFAEDTPRHVQSAAPHALTGHVVHGIKNQPKAG